MKKPSIFSNSPENSPRKFSHSHASHLFDRMKNESTSKMVQNSTKALLSSNENADIFGYDSYYDAIQRVRAENQEKLRLSSKNRAPKYMSSLLESCEKRKRERSIVFEKMAEKQLSKEGNSQGERYISESYKQVLQLNKEFLEKDQEKERQNQKLLAENQKDLTGIYRTLYRENALWAGNRIDVAELQRKKSRSRSRSREKSKKNLENSEKLQGNTNQINERLEGNNEEIRKNKEKLQGDKEKMHKIDEKSLETNEEINKNVSNSENIKKINEISQEIDKSQKKLSARERYLSRKEQVQTQAIEPHE